ncbi:unnamed protein product [Hymenolepis diminuta]|uniref:Uncharacterized protein n=1 Tax=Hymenolepis diminuta TaxID=6216 RepID=A0A564YSY3_HYMDI|nr:unnamed protein product [Hymenolepis diminuta]
MCQRGGNIGNIFSAFGQAFHNVSQGNPSQGNFNCNPIRGNCGPCLNPNGCPGQNFPPFIQGNWPRGNSSGQRTISSMHSGPVRIG